MDILNKIIFYSGSTGRRRDAILAVLAALLAPTWGAANPTANMPPPLGITPTKQHNATTAAPQTMRFITLGRVTFISDKWQLTDAAKRMLDRVCVYLNANPGAERLLLDGHTDSIGTINFNDALSDKRARAVQTYLESKGVDPHLIQWKGHGERAPIDENWNPLGRSRNRQVELYAIYLPSH